MSATTTVTLTSHNSWHRIACMSSIIFLGRFRKDNTGWQLVTSNSAKYFPSPDLQAGHELQARDWTEVKMIKSFGSFGLKTWDQFLGQVLPQGRCPGDLLVGEMNRATQGQVWKFFNCLSTCVKLMDLVIKKEFQSCFPPLANIPWINGAGAVGRGIGTWSHRSYKFQILSL